MCVTTEVCLLQVHVNGNQYKPSVASPNTKQPKVEAATISLQALGLLPSMNQVPYKSLNVFLLSSSCIVVAVQQVSPAFLWQQAIHVIWVGLWALCGKITVIYLTI